MAVADKKESGVDIDRLEADFKADPGNFVPLAKAYLERNLPLQAIQVCRQGLKHNPNAPKGLLALGMAYYQAFDDTNAESTLRKVIKHSPDAATAHRALGEIFLDRGQEQKAIAELARALEIQPANPHARRLLQALGEKVPNLPGENGQPSDSWPARSTPLVQEAAKSIWPTVGQVLVVAAVMVLVIVWYQHHVAVRLQIRKHQQAATAAIPADNYDKLLQAEKELQAAYTLDDTDVRTVVKLATVQSYLWVDHAQSNRRQNLSRLAAWMEEEHIPNPERFSIQALLQVFDGKPAEAEKYLSGIIERAINKKDIFLDASVFGTRALARLRQGKLQEARQDYNRAARFSSDTPHYQVRFADTYLRDNNLDRAVKYFKDALRSNPAHVLGNLRLAYAIIQSGKHLPRARKIIDEYLDAKRHPDQEFSPPLNGLRYLVRAELALASRDVPAANEWARKSLASFDGNAEAHGLAGRLAALNKDAATANAEFTKAIELDPYLPKLFFDRAESTFALGDTSGAIAKLREFEQHMKPTVAYHVKLGQLYMRMDDLQSAMNEFQQAVKVDELSPDARFHVALCFKAQGEKLGSDKKNKEQKLALYNQARKWFEDTLMLPGGERGEVYHEMGRIYLDSEDPDNALDSLGKAAMMMQKAGEPGSKIALVFDDVARVFDYLGGTEGERQAKIYKMKAQGLREGKTLEEVEKEAQQQAQKEAQKKKHRRRRRRRRHRRR